MNSTLRYRFRGSVWLVLVLTLLGACANRPGPLETESPASGASPTALAESEAEPALPSIGEDADLAACRAHAALASPRLRAAFERWKAAVETVVQAGALPDPRFTFGWFVRSVETRVGPQKRKYALRQSFPWFGTLSLREDVASLNARAARQRYEQARRDLFREVDRAWLELYDLERTIEIVRENLRLLGFWETVVRTRYAAAAAEHPDLVRIQVEQGRQEDRLSGLVDRRTAAGARLNALLGRPVDAPAPRPKTLPGRDLAGDAAALRERFARTAPELLALDAEAERESRAGELAEKKLYPDVTVGIEYVETGGALMPGVPDDGKDPVALTFSVNLPFDRDRTHAAVREAAHRRRGVLAMREDVRRRGEATLETALFDLREADRRIDLYRDTLIPKSRQWVDTAITSYQSGRIPLDGLIDAWRTSLEFQLMLERAGVNREKALSDIERLVDLAPGEGGEGTEP